MIDNNFFPILSVFKLPITDFPKTVDAVGPTISKYISDRMSGKT